MKGIIFNIAENFVIDHFGEETLEDIIDACHLETKEPFVGPGTYPDSDMVEILVKACELLNVELGDLLKKLGHYTFGKLNERHPGFAEAYNHPKDFLKTVEDVIHVEVKKLYSDTDLPTFQYAEPADNELIITYYSKRKLYPLMEGLIDGVFEHFGIPSEQSHKIYEKNGVELCDFHLKFSK